MSYQQRLQDIKLGYHEAGIAGFSALIKTEREYHSESYYLRLLQTEVALYL